MQLAQIHHHMFWICLYTRQIVKPSSSSSCPLLQPSTSYHSHRPTQSPLIPPHISNHIYHFVAEKHKLPQDLPSTFARNTYPSHNHESSMLVQQFNAFSVGSLQGVQHRLPGFENFLKWSFTNVTLFCFRCSIPFDKFRSNRSCKQFFQHKQVVGY